MKKNLLRMLLPISIFTICLFVLSAWLNQEKAVQPKAVSGMIDLRQYDFSQMGPVELNGEWEFIPGKLLDSNDFEKQTSYLVQVPSLWTSYDLQGGKVPKYTSGTYRLKIKIDSDNEILGLKTSGIRMSNAAYINGKLVGQSGRPGEDSSYIPHNIPYVSYFSPEK